MSAAGPVLAGILEAVSAEDVLRRAFDEAQHRAVGLHVLVAGLPPADELAVSELADRWSGKYPEVPVSVSVSSVLDPAITLAAATRSSRLAVVGPAGDARVAATVRAVRRRATCPLIVA
jgi:hypothetical protein